MSLWLQFLIIVNWWTYILVLTTPVHTATVKKKTKVNSATYPVPHLSYILSIFSLLDTPNKFQIFRYSINQNTPSLREIPEPEIS